MNGYGTWDGVIRSKEDWWMSCNARWENILDIFSNIGAPMGRGEEDRWWSDGIGRPDTEHAKCLVQTLEDMRAARDPKLHFFLNRAHGSAPDKEYIHSWEGWSAFCNLCSEGEVLYEDITTEEDVAHGRHPSEGTS